MALNGKLRLGTTALVAALALGATAAAADPVHVNFWFNNKDAGYDRAMQGLVERFNQTHTDIQVDYTDIGLNSSKADYMAKLAASVAAGEPPDVAWMDGETVDEWAFAKGAIIPISDIDPTYNFDAIDFIPGAVRTLKVGGKWMGMPFRTDARGLFYNLDMYEAAGLDPNTPPATTTDLDAAAQKLTKIDPQGKMQQLGFVPWSNNDATGLMYLWMWGGDYFDWDTLRPKLTGNPANLEAVQWIKSYSDRFGNVKVHSTDFAHGLESMRIDSTTFLGTLPSQAPKMRFSVGRIPAAPGQPNITMSSAVSFAVPAGAKHPKEALQFMLYLVSTDAQVQWYKSIHSLPIRFSALAQIGNLITDPNEKIMVDMLQFAHMNPPMVTVIRDAFGDAQNQMKQGKLSPKAVLEQVQSVVEPQYEAAFGGKH